MNIPANLVPILVGVLTLGMVLQTCNSCQTKRVLSDIETKMDSVSTLVLERPSAIEISRIIESQGIQSLLYEEAIDQGKLSIAEVEIRLQNMRTPMDSVANDTVITDTTTP